MSATRSRRHSTRRERRRARERKIVATRAPCSKAGRRDAPVNEIARAAGLNKALIYRSFESKEEIFVLTVADYLAELQARAAELSEPGDPCSRCARPASATSTSVWSIPRSWTALWLSCNGRPPSTQACLRRGLVSPRAVDGRVPRAA